MPALLDTPEAFDKLGLVHGFHDDFDHFVTADTWTTVASDSGTIAVADGVGGRITLNPSDGTVANNDETNLKATKETFLFANNKPIHFKAAVQFTEGNTDDVNIFVGVKDAIAANTLLDDGGGPAASYSGMCFFKVDGETRWRVECSLAGTQITSETSVTAGGAADQRLEIIAIPISSTVVEITYYVNGVQCIDYTSRQPIAHKLTYTSATEMQAGLGIKNGADTTVEALVADYVGCYQKR